jgi:hypothetical protein
VPATKIENDVEKGNNTHHWMKKEIVMRAVRVGLAILVCLTISAFTQYVFAHDGEWGTEEIPLDISGDIESVSDLDLLHNDLDPWKGWATFNVKNLSMKNLSPVDWGDFHLKIKESWCSDVDFRDDYVTGPSGYDHRPQLLIWDGSSWEQVLYPDLTWAIDNGEPHATMDLFFYGNPVEFGEKVKIRVYTDNTIGRHSSFSILAHPTPVPEPTTLALLGLGAVALFRRAKR